jgi:hypothetical protein
MRLLAPGRPKATTADQCDGLLQSLRDQINVVSLSSRRNKRDVSRVPRPQRGVGDVESWVLEQARRTRAQTARQRGDAGAQHHVGAGDDQFEVKHGDVRALAKKIKTNMRWRCLFGRPATSMLSSWRSS